MVWIGLADPNKLKLQERIKRQIERVKIEEEQHKIQDKEKLELENQKIHEKDVESGIYSK